MPRKLYVRVKKRSATFRETKPIFYELTAREISMRSFHCWKRQPRH